LKTNPGHEAVKYPVYDNDNWGEEGAPTGDDGSNMSLPIILNIKTDMGDMGDMEDDDGDITSESFPEEMMNGNVKEEAFF